MSENEDLIEQTNEKKKKGRKPTTKKYFDEPEENAVKLYLISDSSEVKNKIYNEFLRDPLDKMISSINPCTLFSIFPVLINSFIQL